MCTIATTWSVRTVRGTFDPPKRFQACCRHLGHWQPADACDGEAGHHCAGMHKNSSHVIKAKNCHILHLQGKCSASALPVADTTPAVAGPSPSASLYTITQHTLTGFPWRTDTLHLGASSLQQHSAPDDTAASTGNFPADPSPASRTADVPFVLYMPKAAATATSAIVGPAPSSTPSTPAAHSGLLPGSATSPFPVVVVLSPGFLVDPAAYDSYCRHLAAAGVPTITYRKPQESATAPWDDLQSERLVRSLMDWWEREARGSRQDAAGGPAGGTALTVSNPAPSAPEQAIATPQRTAFVLAGHSRGGKVRKSRNELGKGREQFGLPVTCYHPPHCLLYLQPAFRHHHQLMCCSLSATPAMPVWTSECQAFLKHHLLLPAALFSCGRHLPADQRAGCSGGPRDWLGPRAWPPAAGPC